MRKIFFSFLAFFALALAPSAYGVGLSEPTTLVDQTITAEEASNYHVEVPQDLDPGFYQMNIELYDSCGVLKTQTIRLCKNLNGEVDWSASCPDLVPVYSLESINNIENRSDLPVYSALMEPKKQIKNIIAALASVSLVVTGANTLTQQAPERR